MVDFVPSFVNVWRGPGVLDREAFYGYFTQGREHPAIAGPDEDGIAPGSSIGENGSLSPSKFLEKINSAAIFNGISALGYAQINDKLDFPFVSQGNTISQIDLQVDYDMYRLGTSGGNYKILVYAPKLYQNFFAFNDGVLSDPVISASSFSLGSNAQMWIHIEEARPGQPVKQVWRQGSINSTITTTKIDTDRGNGTYYDAAIVAGKDETIKGVYLIIQGNTGHDLFAFLQNSPSTILGPNLRDNINNAGAFDAFYPALAGEYSIHAVNGQADIDKIMGGGSLLARWAHVVSSDGQFPTGANLTAINKTLGVNFNDAQPETLAALAPITAANPSQTKAIAAVYQTLLGGTPSVSGFDFLIKGNLASNFGAGSGTVFNDENVYINVANALVQGNQTAAATFNTLATGATLSEKITSLYTKIIPAARQTADGVAFLTQPDGLKFFQDVAAERGISSANGPAVTALASLLKIAVDNRLGIGNAVGDLVASIADGSSSLPATSTAVLPIETIDGTRYDADDAADAMPGFSGPPPLALIGIAADEVVTFA